ncbi:MAG: hypothetical protein PF482_07990, partial [Desulfobacteraceae bacterium]|nr:hypothetical protein [Desulfobacteraceae bacterium]
EDGTAYRRHGKGLSSVHYMLHLSRLAKIFRANCVFIPTEIKPFVFFNLTRMMIRLALFGYLKKYPRAYEALRKLALFCLKP